MAKIVATVISILLPIIIVVLIASIILAIFQAIIDAIKDIVIGLVNGIINFITHPIKSLINGLYQLHNAYEKYTNGEFDGSGLEINQDPQLVVIDQEAFEAMRDSIDQSIDRKATGLDDTMLKKMLLAYAIGNYSRNADVIIQLTSEEKEACDDDKSLSDPFKIKKGKDIKQLKVNGLESLGNSIVGLIDESKRNEEIDSKKALHDNYFLCAKGSLIFKAEMENEDGELELVELQYFNEEVLKSLYEEQYLKNVDTEYNDYAESVWKYLGKCYTDGTTLTEDNQIAYTVGSMNMYSYEKVDENLTEWTFKDDDLGAIEINRHLNVNINKTRTIQNIEYSSLVSQYSTPVEFMVNLLEITASRDFVNAFIEKVANQTSIEVVLYKTGYSNTEVKKETIKETTKVTGKVKCEPEIRRMLVQISEEETEWRDASSSIRAECKTRQKNVGGIKRVIRIIYFKNVPSNVVKIKFRIAGESGFETYSVSKDSDGDFFWKDEEYWLDEYVTKENSCNITQTQTIVDTETKYDIAIGEVTTWYAKIKYNTSRNTDIEHRTINQDGDLVKVNSPIPIMIEYDKEDEVYEKNSTNKTTTFNDLTTIKSFTVQEIGNQIEKWYANLEADQHAYYLTGGKSFRDLYELLDGNEYALATPEQCVNVRYAYAKQEGLFDWWFRYNYDIYKITCKADEYKKGTLITTITSYLVEEPPVVKDNTDFFLSLLKNDTGKYSIDEEYNPNGKDVEYTDLYKLGKGESNAVVGKLLVNGEAMLYELLDSSPNTQDLVDIMGHIIWKYKEGKSGSIAIETLLRTEKVSDSTIIIGETTEEKVWCTLRSLGLSEYAVAGVMGNIAVDTQFDDNAIKNASKPNIGLLQWNGTRKAALELYAKSKQISAGDINTQIQYLVGEITQGGGCERLR